MSSIHRVLNRGKGIRPENQPYCLAGFTKRKSDSITRVQTSGPLVIRELQRVIDEERCQQRPVFQDFGRGDLVVDSSVPAAPDCTAITRTKCGTFFDAGSDSTEPIRKQHPVNSSDSRSIQLDKL
ncbi:hypothetical protein Enr17x_14990 [Gimesia fumaroli]|uniref:Uncharacterized protein n=1 Tax=Gimesia fumaroli TaxID=2527976 RepID=A0A518I8Q8_9PLAN|nr:hypothetical protein Enr17x_14990 [Gimesia fumaroli]